MTSPVHAAIRTTADLLGVSEHVAAALPAHIVDACSGAVDRVPPAAQVVRVMAEMSNGQRRAIARLVTRWAEMGRMPSRDEMEGEA